uniref:Uncharacterized protein n=1 Tax=Tanacetum cinerariifolium TaxID=118510 RepID=A0A699I9M1_TANCI|nr:hypothetical protein [Tanacetum cinerariifolium]
MYTMLDSDVAGSNIITCNGADEELSDGGSPPVIVYGYDRLPMRPVAPPSPDYVPGPEHPPYSNFVPGPKHPPSPFYPLPADASPTALSPGYVANSDLDEDPEEDHADYPSDGGDDDDDDDDTGDKDEEPFEDEEDDKKEKHLALADSPAVPVIGFVPSAEDTEVFKTNEDAPTPMPSPRWHTTRMSARPQTPVPWPSEAEVERLLALRIPPPSPLTLPSSPLPQIPSHPLPPPPSSLHLPPPVPTSLPLPLSPLLPLPASLSIPSPVDRKEDFRGRVTISPTGGHRADYGFIGMMDAEIKSQRAEEVGYGIKDDWEDPIKTVEEVALTNLEGVNARVTELAAVQEKDTHDMYAVTEDTQDRQT